MKFAVTTTSPDVLDYPIIVHSHLGWDWVWQRPQQLISRLSARHRVLFVEQAVENPETKQPSLRIREVDDYPNILVLQILLPPGSLRDLEGVDRERRRQLQNFLSGPVGAEFVNPVQWFYDPLAVPAFAGQMDEQAIVYDCMDQLAQFRFAPPALQQRERELLGMADVVFAGGPAIYEDKVRLNSNCFCFGCGVDAEHFGGAEQARENLPEELRSLPRPILGYMGVVDERLDYPLIAALAESHSGSVVFVGPTAKVDPNHLPQSRNLHWLGQRDYSLLPQYLGGLDVCLMPFALNEATEFINPTKALEYMATGRPIVSTAITDVVRQFDEIVHIARSHEEFIAACRRACVEPDQGALRRGLELARENSWDRIVERMEGHVADALCRRSSTVETAA